MRICLARKECEALLKADLRFSSSSIINDRTIRVADIFGIDLDEHEFVLYNNIIIEINPGDIVYITGESGGGKSQLLKIITEELEKHKEFGMIVRDKDIIDSIDDRPIIEQVGKDISEAIRILSVVGLNEAYIMLRKYDQLSDGQKYRFRIAKMLDSNADTLIMDEFLSMLDRTTAKVVAYTIQRAVRRFKKTLVVATAHDDLAYDLNPDLIITKNFGSNVRVKRCKVEARECSILDRVKIVEGSIDEYNELKDLHYRKGRIIPKFIYKAVIDDEIAGVIVYGPAHLTLKARNIVLPEYKKSSNGKAHAKRINSDIIRIWRVIVKPKYRGAGLATRLVRDTLRLTNYAYVEALAVMAQYSNFFEHAGMIKVNPELYNTFDKAYLKALDRLRALGFDTSLLVSRKYCKDRLAKLSNEELEEVKDIVIKHFYSPKFKHPSKLSNLIKGDIDALADALCNRRLPYVYLIWKNPIYKDKPDPKIF